MRRIHRPSLERCVGEVGRFLAEVWAKQPLYHPSPGAGGFEDLLTLGDVDRIVSTMALRLPAFRLVKRGVTLDPASYTRTGRTGSTPVRGIADPARIFQAFGDGATIVFQGMHRYWAPLTAFCRELELELGHPAQVNAYITPPGAQGLAPHQDSHDVFVLQAFGRKRWEVWEAASRDGSQAGSRLASSLDPERPSLVVELRPGDSLYLPQGTMHAARTQESVSGHLTVGILNYTWRRVLQQVFKRLEREPDLQERLPVGYHVDPESFAREVEDRLRDLERWIAKISSTDVATEAVRTFLTSRASLVSGGMQDILLVDSVGDDSLVRRRSGGVCDLLLEGSQLIALLGDRELRMPAALEPAMRRVAELDEFRVRDLQPFLDPESRLMLVKRLVREGLLEVALES